jgi:hypothetical protein
MLEFAGGQLMKLFLTLAVLAFVQQAKADSSWFLGFAMYFDSNTPGNTATLEVGPNQSQALTDFIIKNSCIPDGALSDGTLDLTVRFKGQMYGHDLSKQWFRVSFCGDAVNGSSLANVQLRMATSAAKLTSKNNLGVWISGPSAPVSASYTYATVSRQVVSSIGLQSSELMGSYLPIHEGQTMIINMETPAIGGNTTVNLSNSLGDSYLRIVSHPN